jgi:hypothetical protein
MAQNKEVLLDYRSGCAAPETLCQATIWLGHVALATTARTALSLTGSPPAVTGGRFSSSSWIEGANSRGAMICDKRDLETRPIVASSA